jgi:hypothetical protein
MTARVAPVIIGAILGVASVFGAKAVTPSYFNATFLGCSWPGLGRLGSTSQGWTSTPCAAQSAYLYQQYINSGGTVYTYWGGWLAGNNHYHEETISGLVELYGEHNIAIDWQSAGLRSTDATY